MRPLGVQAALAGVHLPGGGDRRARRGRAGVGGAEDGHHGVADVLHDGAALAEDGRVHRPAGGR